MDSASTHRKRHLLLGAAFGVGVLGLLLTCFVESSDSGQTADLTSVEETSAHHEIDETGLRSPVPEMLVPAPLGESQPREQARILPQRDPIELRVFCTPTTYRWIGRPLESAFEDQERGVDLVLEKHSDRDCVGHLLMGHADVVLIGGALSQSEMARGLVERIIAHRIVVPVVHVSNPIESLHGADLRSILDGRLDSWRDAGGSELRILPVCERVVRRGDEASLSLSVHQGGERLAEFLETPAEILAFVSNNPQAVGLVDLVHARNVHSVRMLDVNGVPANRDAMVRGAWPLGASIRAVRDPNEDALAKTFVAFLDSDVARRVLGRHFTLPR